MTAFNRALYAGSVIAQLSAVILAFIIVVFQYLGYQVVPSKP
jgi:hypothetical protein